MKKNYFLLLVVSVILASCASSLTVTKRKHRKGYYVAWSSGKNTESGNSTPLSDLKKANKLAFANALTLVSIPEREMFIPPLENEKLEQDLSDSSKKDFKKSSSPQVVLFGTNSSGNQLNQKHKFRLQAEHYLLISSFLSLGLLAIFRKKKAAIVRFAQAHKRKVQVGLTIVLGGLFLGSFLNGYFNADKFSLLKLIGTSAVGVLTYAFNKVKMSYMGKKALTVVMLVSNMGLGQQIGSYIATASASNQMESIHVLKENNALTANQQDVASVVLGVLGTILIIILGTGLIWAVIVLSCSIACSGYGVLAILVLIAGGVGVFVLCYQLIKNLWRWVSKTSSKGNQDIRKNKSTDNKKSNRKIDPFNLVLLLLGLLIAAYYAITVF